MKQRQGGERPGSDSNGGGQRESALCAATRGKRERDRGEADTRGRGKGAQGSERSTTRDGKRPAPTKTGAPESEREGGRGHEGSGQKQQGAQNEKGPEHARGAQRDRASERLGEPQTARTREGQIYVYVCEG